MNSYYDIMTEEEKRFILQHKRDIAKVACTPFCESTYKVVLHMSGKIINKLYLKSDLIKLAKE